MSFRAARVVVTALTVSDSTFLHVASSMCLVGITFTFLRYSSLHSNEFESNNLVFLTYQN